jgi:hypothetical protein
MSQFLDKLSKYFNIKISLFALSVASAFSFIGFYIYPNFIFHYGLITLFFIFAIATPILIIWRVFYFSGDFQRKLLITLSSIWIGLFLTFITTHTIFTRLGEKMWKNTAIKTEMYLNNFYSDNGYYPSSLIVFLDSPPNKENFITRRYMSLIRIDLVDSLRKDIFPFDEFGYRLETGFWLADLRIWNPQTKEWTYIY